MVSASVPARVAAEVSSNGKRRNLSPGQLLEVIKRDFSDGQYYITGKLDQSIFADDCEFIDPTTNVKGPGTYSKAVAALFDHETSRADLISIEVTDPQTITSRWRFDAAINFPGKPRIKPYTGSTRYIIKDGLIQQHIETWDISTLDAFVSIFIPSFGAPPAPPVARIRSDLDAQLVV
ncbi:hypothetical protein COCOBI_01-6480 [Coccomyxa sp. Obi]|nr:hypothetical protein COCOBI_01-6480 [Coccomyxa sp. Obi]